MVEEVTTVPDASVEAVANAALQLTNAASSKAPPQTLPPGWVLKESKSQPNYYYYYNQETGACSWDSPLASTEEQEAATTRAPLLELPPVPHNDDEEDEQEDDEEADHNDYNNDDDKEVPKTKRPLVVAEEHSKSSKKRKTPQKVRVLHILRKHKDSRRASSWRNPTITLTKQEALDELKGLEEIIQESSGDPEELRATFEEIARTESDCSSAKRGGDLGFFGRKKMQPAFEEASFALEVGQLSGIVETSSGVHIIYRIG